MQTKSMSVLQAFRVVLTALSSSKPPRFTLQTGADSSAVATAAAAASCVALDATGALNVLQPVPLAAWQHAQRAAAASLAALSGPFGVAGAAAAPLLAPQRCALLACDAVLRVQLPAPPAPARLAGDAPWPAAAARRAESLLKRALSDRAHAVSVTPLPPAPVAVQRTPLLPGLEVDAELECRILLNPTEVCASAPCACRTCACRCRDHPRASSRQAEAGCMRAHASCSCMVSNPPAAAPGPRNQCHTGATSQAICLERRPTPLNPRPLGDHEHPHLLWRCLTQPCKHISVCA